MPGIMDVKVNDPLLQRLTKRLVADGTTATMLASDVDVQGSTFTIPVWDTVNADTAGKVKELGLSQPSPLTDVNLTVVSGTTKEYGRAARLAYKTSTNIQPGLDVRAALMGTPYEEMQLQQELDFVAVAQNTTNMGGTMPASAAWTIVGTNIRFDLIDAKEAFPKQARGKAPNTIIIPPGAWSSIQKNTAFIEQYKYQAGATLTHRGLEMTTLEDLRLIVPGRVYNTAGLGLATSMGYVWPYDSTTVAVVCYIEPSSAAERMGWIRKVRNTAYGPAGEIADSWWNQSEKTYYYDYRSDVSFFVQTAEYALGITGIHS